MITNAILFIFIGLVEVLLAPLSILNFSVDILNNIPLISDFLKVITYILPWNNLLPIISFIVAMFGYRAVLALIRVVKSFIPTMSY